MDGEVVVNHVGVDERIIIIEMVEEEEVVEERMIVTTTTIIHWYKLKWMVHFPHQLRISMHTHHHQQLLGQCPAIIMM